MLDSISLATALYGPPHKDGLNLTQAELRAWVDAERDARDWAPGKEKQCQ